VNVNVPVDVGVLVIHPGHISRLRLGERCGAVESLGSGVCGCWRDGRIELLGEVPEEVEVPVEVYTNAEGFVGPSRGWVAVLSPEVAVGLVVAHAVWVQHGNEYNSSTKSLLDLAVGVLLVAVSETNTVLVRIKKVRDEVDQVVRPSALTCVDSCSS